jgi:hypothetical protein
MRKSMIEPRLARTPEEERQMSRVSDPNGSATGGSLVGRLVLAWMLVGVPLAWGVWQVFKKSLDLFR